MSDAKVAAKAWLRRQTGLARREIGVQVALNLAGVALAVVQAFAVARVLAIALTGPVAAPAATLLAARLPWLWGPLGLPLGAFALAALLRAVLGYRFELASVQAGAAARRRLRSDALARLLAAGPAALRGRHSGELASIVVDRVEALDGMFARWLPASRLALAAPALVALAALWADPLAALLMLGAGLLVPVGMAFSGIGAAAASRRQFVALGRLQARFLDRMRGIATIVLAGRAEDEEAALGRAAAELRQRTMRVLRVAFLSSAALDCAAALALVVLAIRYAGALHAGTLTDPARALFALLLVPEFFAPLRNFAAAYQDRMQAEGAATALADLPALPSPQPARPVRNVAARGVTVAFEEVRLSWDRARGPALDWLSFRVPPGETLVLAGPSGAGKSSVIAILLGFVRPDAWRVTINGADIAELVPEALSRLTAWIGQRPVLFAGSIRENIRFARPEATDAEVADAAAAARVDGFAAALPLGLDTELGEDGFGLSGGQAQRVAIARAFLKNAPLLLLDEPTAHLDPATEAEVLDSLRRLALGRTVILASHATAAHGFAGRRLDLREGRAVAARGAA